MGNNLKEWKTTILGGLFLLIGTVITLIEYFTVPAFSWNHYALPIGFVVVGGGLFLAPDRFINFVFRLGKKKTGIE